MTKPADWLNNPEYVKLVEFLVKKTKNGKKVLRFKKLAREFKKKVDSELNIRCLEGRIDCFRRNILILSHLDTDTKVKLLFGLSAPVDYGFLRELRKEADVTVDDSNRIIHYKKRGGGLELKGKHKPCKAEVSSNQILEFLAEKVKKASGITELTGLAKQFKAETGSSHHEVYLQLRIRRATKQIYESKLFDENMKVKMIFATSTVVEDYALKELRKNAFVVVDKKNRIVEYKKKDGSLYLNRKEYKLKRGSRSNIVDESDDVGDSDEDVEEQHGYSSNDSENEEEESLEVTTRSGRVSKKKFSVASSFNNQDNMGNSSPRIERSKSSNTPTTSNKKRKTPAHTNGSVGKKKKTVEAITTEEEESQERAPEDRHDDDYSFDVSYQPDDEQRVKLEPFKGPLNDDTTRLHIINNGEDFVEEIPAPTENFIAPKYEEMLMDVKMEGLDAITDVTDKEVKSEQDSQIHEVEKKADEDVVEIFDGPEPRNSSNNQFNNRPVQKVPTSCEDVKKDQTPLHLILESFHDLIDTLDLPILSNLQKKIETKLEECKGDSILKMVSNEEIYHSLQLFLLKVNKNWDIKESVESFRLESFMISFKHAAVHMKCPNLVELQKKLKGILGELRVQNKFIPVTAIRSALQSVIDNIINS